MNISQNGLRRAAAASGLSIEQADQVWTALKSDAESSERPRFDDANIAYYFGALIVIGAMGWFITKAWERFGGLGLFAIALCYAVSFVIAGRVLWKKPGLRVPSGLLITMAVCMVPLAVYGLERWSGFWPADDPGAYTRFHPYINGSWLIMEAATIVAGLVALRFFRFPFITAPIAYALWYMSMDLVHLISGGGYMSWHEKANITAVFGALMLLGAYLIDLLGKSEDYAFWAYLFGTVIFWGGLSSMESHGEMGRLVYFLVNLLLMACSIALRRQVLMVFGALGVFWYLGHLAYSVFQDSVLFPLVLTVIGLLIIFLGVQYQKRRKDLENRFRARIAPHIKMFIPHRALAE
ncbi:MAG TPA: hypothetical protein VJ719_03445 [Chthoniobacterales bacterium]|nr:hypothetical protein [Chthoniobacterales bacterium]